MTGTVVFLSGPVGAGKTTLGRALAGRIGGSRGAGFIDGDDHQTPGRPWYGSILQTSRAIQGAALALLERHPVVVVAYPLRRREWVFHQRHFGTAGVRTLVVSLRAPHAAIIAAVRGRSFSPAERDRIAVMIAEGYDMRPFSDLNLNTDRPIADTLAELEQGLRVLMAG